MHAEVNTRHQNALLRLAEDLAGALARYGPRSRGLGLASGARTARHPYPEGLLAIDPLLKQRAAPKACLRPECGRVLNPVTMIPLRSIQAIGLQAEKIPCTSRVRG